MSHEIGDIGASPLLYFHHRYITVTIHLVQQAYLCTRKVNQEATENVGHDR